METKILHFLLLLFFCIFTRVSLFKNLNFRISDRIKTINIFLISVGFYNLMESNIGILLIPKGFLTNEPLTDGLLSPIGNFCAGSDNYLTL